MGPRLLAIALGVAFVVAGLDKILNIEMASQLFGMWFGGQSWLVYVTLVIEILGGLALIANWHGREAAMVL